MATVTDKKVIIDLTINSADATKAIVDAKNAIDNLKNAQKNWKEALKDGKVTQDQYYAAMAQLNAQIKELNSTVKTNEKVLLDNIKGAKAQGESLNAMRANLKTLIKQYDDLDAAQRDAAKGKELLQYISDLTLEIKELEYEQQIFKRNVGNYMDALGGGNQMTIIIKQFQQLSVGTMNVGVAFKNATLMVKSFGKQLLALMSNPWVALIGLIVAIVLKLVDAFKKNDEAMTALQAAFSAFQPILDMINKLFNILVGVITKVIEGITELVTKIIGALVPGFAEASNAAQQYTKDLDALEEAERQYTVESAKNEAQIAELRDKAVDKEKYTAQERIKFNKQAQDLEEKNYKMQKDLAAERLRLAKIEQQRDNDYSDERKNKIAELEAAYIKADADYYNAHRSLAREQQRFEKEIENEEKQKEKERQQRAKEWQQKLKEMRENELKAVREYQDAVIAAMDEGFQKHIKEIQIQGEREIEDLKKRLKEEKNLTKKAREAINALIAEKQKELNRKLILEQAQFWAETRDEISKAMSDSSNFINAAKLENDLKQLSNAFRASIAQIDEAGLKATANLQKAFHDVFEQAIRSGDKFVLGLRNRVQPNLNLDNFKESLAEFARIYIAKFNSTIEEVEQKLSDNPWIAKLNEIYKEYIASVGAQSRQVNQMIVDATSKAAQSIQKSIFDAISNGTVTAYQDWLQQHEGFARAMADKFGDSYLDQMKGIMLNIDTMISDAYAQISQTTNTGLIDKIRTYIKDLEQVREIITGTNRVEKEAIEFRQKKAQATVMSKNAELEIARLNIDEKIAARDRLQSQLDYLAAIRATVEEKSKAYEQTRRETADQWEQLEDQRLAVEKKLNDLRNASMISGIAIDPKTIEDLERQIDEIVEKEHELTRQVSESAGELASTGFSSLEEFNKAQEEMVTKVMEANAKIAEDTKKLHDTEVNTWLDAFNTVADAASQLSTAFGDLFSTLAEDNEEMQKYSNSLAMVDIMVQMAVGVATAVAEGMKLGWPAAIAAIAAGVAAVVSGISSAIAIFKKNSKVKSAPKFSTGGLVGNKTTTRTDDTVDAKLSEGEYVIRSAVVKKLGVSFFDKLNGKRTKKNDLDTHFATGGLVTSPNTQTFINTQQIDFNYDQMKEVFSEVVSEIQPVVSVKEINDMQTRVKVKEQTSLS